MRLCHSWSTRCTGSRCNQLFDYPILLGFSEFRFAFSSRARKQKIKLQFIEIPHQIARRLLDLHSLGHPDEFLKMHAILNENWLDENALHLISVGVRCE